MIAAADTWLLAQHQRAVDASGRTPGWWCEQCALMSGALSIAVWALGSRGIVHTVFLFLILTLSAIAFLVARAPEAMAFWYGAPWNRRLNLCCFAIAIGGDVVVFAATGQPFTAHHGLCDLGSATWTCLVFFAACKPPAPRPPKRRLALSGGAA